MYEKTDRKPKHPESQTPLPALPFFGNGKMQTHMQTTLESLKQK